MANQEELTHGLMSKRHLDPHLPKLRLDLERFEMAKVLPSGNIYDISKLHARRRKQREI